MGLFVEVRFTLLFRPNRFLEVSLHDCPCGGRLEVSPAVHPSNNDIGVGMKARCEKKCFVQAVEKPKTRFAACSFFCSHGILQGDGFGVHETGRKQHEARSWARGAAWYVGN